MGDGSKRIDVVEDGHADCPAAFPTCVSGRCYATEATIAPTPAPTGCEPDPSKCLAEIREESEIGERRSGRPERGCCAERASSEAN